MAGTKEGGARAAATNKAKYGSDFYREIGSKGGKLGRTGGFYKNRELAREAGRKGGTISRRGKKEVIHTALPGTHAADLVRNEEIDDIAAKLVKDVMSYEQPKRPSFFGRFKKARV